MNFMQKHGRVIGNVAVAVLVILAVYAKISGEDKGTSPLFGRGDSPLIVGALVVFVVMAWIIGRAQKR